MTKVIAVYSILCVPSGKRYVGSSINTVKRMSRHRTDLRNETHHSPHLQRAWRRYGETCFCFEVLETLQSPENLRVREQYFIDMYSASDPATGFNMNQLATGGDGRQVSLASRKKMSESHKGKRLSESQRAKIGRKGSLHHAATVGESDIASIKLRLAAGERQRVLAEEYGMTRTTVNDIAAGRSWSHVLPTLLIPRGPALGSSRRNAVLTETVVRDVRDRLVLGETVTGLAKEFKVSFMTISDIKKGKTWKHV